MFATKWLVVASVAACVVCTDSRARTWHQDTRSPSDVMVDVINNLGLNILKIHNDNNENNIALSPYGVASILTALLEGVRGHAAHEIQQCGGFPADKDVLRVGLRDIHRLLRSYFIPQEGFLSGLSLSSEKVTLRPDYQSILRFYGFDMTSFNTPIYPDLGTTTALNNITEPSSTDTTMLTTETITTETTEETTTMQQTPQPPEDETTTNTQETTLPTTIPTTMPSTLPTTIPTTMSTTPMSTESPTTVMTTMTNPVTVETTTVETTQPETSETKMMTVTEIPETTRVMTTVTNPETSTQKIVTTTEAVTTTETTTFTVETTVTPSITTTQNTQTIETTTSGLETTTESIETTTDTSETTTFRIRRIGRSIVDYFIAKYYDDRNPEIYTHNVPENNKLSFLVNGKYLENHVHFMTYDAILPFFYIHNLNALALRFPLDSPKYYLLLVLPVDEQGINRLICDIGNSITLKQIVSHMRPTYVRAVIPSFMLRGFVILTSSLQKIGIRQIFEPRHADFSSMTNDKDIYVTNIEQAITVLIKNYMDASMLPKNGNLYQYGPVEFKATHPFLYFVMDSEIDVTLVAGKVVNPINSRIQ